MTDKLGREFDPNAPFVDRWPTDTIRQALKVQRSLSRTGHWCYSLPLHLALAAELGKREKKERCAA